MKILAALVLLAVLAISIYSVVGTIGWIVSRLFLFLVLLAVGYWALHTLKED